MIIMRHLGKACKIDGGYMWAAWCKTIAGSWAHFKRMGREHWISGWGGRWPEPILCLGAEFQNQQCLIGFGWWCQKASMHANAVPEWERLFTWQTEPTASMAHISKHFATLSSAPAATQLELQKAEIWKRGLSCKTGRRGYERLGVLHSQTLCNENTPVIFTFLVLYQLPITAAFFPSHEKHVLPASNP